LLGELSYSRHVWTYSISSHTLSVTRQLWVTRGTGANEATSRLGEA